MERNLTVDRIVTLKNNQLESEVVSIVVHRANNASVTQAGLGLTFSQTMQLSLPEAIKLREELEKIK